MQILASSPITVASAGRISAASAFSAVGGAGGRLKVCDTNRSRRSWKAPPRRIAVVRGAATRRARAASRSIVSRAPFTLMSDS